jgi:hypothetical protein
VKYTLTLLKEKHAETLAQQLRKTNICLLISARLFSWKSVTPTEKIFIKFYIGDFY